MNNQFNIRVYGVLINDQQQVLVSDEYIRGGYYTKFPGGGLEFGEGTRDCLVREFKEEMDLNVKVGSHLYTTDYYQQSAFNPLHQIISIYYYVEALEQIQVVLADKAHMYTDIQMEKYDQQGSIESFRFIDLNDFSADCLTLPIDKIVGDIIAQKR